MKIIFSLQVHSFLSHQKTKMNPQNINEFCSSIAHLEKFMLQKSYTSIIWLTDGKIKASLEIVQVSMNIHKYGEEAGFQGNEP